MLDAADRDAAVEILRSSKPLDADNLTATMSRRPAPVPGAQDDRYHVGEMAAYWSNRIESIDLAKEVESRRVYAVNGVDGAPVNAEAARKKRLEYLDNLRGQATTALSAWNDKVKTDAHAA